MKMLAMLMLISICNYINGMHSELSPELKSKILTEIRVSERATARYNGVYKEAQKQIFARKIHELIRSINQRVAEIITQHCELPQHGKDTSILSLNIEYFVRNKLKPNASINYDSGYDSDDDNIKTINQLESSDSESESEIIRTLQYTKE